MNDKIQYWRDLVLFLCQLAVAGCVVCIVMLGVDLLELHHLGDCKNCWFLE